MDKKEIRAILQELDQEKVNLTRQIAIINDRLSDIDAALKSMSALLQGPLTENPIHVGGMRQEILTVLEETHRDWTPQDLEEELIARGFIFHVKDTRNSIYSALRREQASGRVISTRRGLYRATKFIEKSND